MNHRDIAKIGRQEARSVFKGGEKPAQEEQKAADTLVGKTFAGIRPPIGNGMMILGPGLMAEIIDWVEARQALWAMQREQHLRDPHSVKSG